MESVLGLSREEICQIVEVIKKEEPAVLSPEEIRQILGAAQKNP